jgi:hypothetical protein
VRRGKGTSHADQQAASRRAANRPENAVSDQGAGGCPPLQKLAGTVIVSPTTSTILFDKEGEGDVSVAGCDLLLQIERRHELAEHRSLADRLQAAAAGRDEGAFLDQIEHVAGAVGCGIYFSWNGLV